MKNSPLHKQPQASIGTTPLHPPPSSQPVGKARTSKKETKEIILLKIASHLQEAWEQKFENYRTEEVRRQVKLNRSGKGAELVKEFAKYGIHFNQEILPPFWKIWWGGMCLWAAKKATIEVKQEYRRWLKRYEGPVRVITEEGAPFTEALKKYLKDVFSWLSQLNLGDELLKHTQSLLAKDGIKITLGNIDRAPGKHPAWRELQVEIFQLLQKKGVSQTQAWSLIGKLFRNLIPHWFDLLHPEAAIRLNVQSRLKTKHSL